jgi:hypothetical protein
MKEAIPMTQAERVHSTPPTNTPTRRRFLSTTATLAAGSAALAAIPPALAAAAPAGSLDATNAGPQAVPNPDAELFDLEERIFKHKEAADAIGLRASPLNAIFNAENRRLHREFEATGSPTFDNRKAIIDAMPEFIECMRLRELQQIEWSAAEDLVKQMWAIEAQTPEGRRAKVLVLLGYVMEDDEWRRAFDGAFDVTRARDLIIEFVGGEPAQQLRDQFAA